MSFYVVIPARLASTRLPNKPLADIGGKPMVVRVAEKAAFAGAKDIIVATDDQSIVDACEKHAVKAVLTRKDHVSGTDRIAEVSAKMNWSAADVVVNVQGDEPLIDPELISATAALVSENVPMATGSAPDGTAGRDLQSQFRQSRSGPVQQGAVLFTGPPFPGTGTVIQNRTKPFPIHSMPCVISVCMHSATISCRHTLLFPFPR